MNIYDYSSVRHCKPDPIKNIKGPSLQLGKVTHPEVKQETVTSGYVQVGEPQNFDDIELKTTTNAGDVIIYDMKAREENGMREFDTGAHRDTGEGKLRASLIPNSCLERIAKRYLDGANKYGENNWTLGMKSSVYYDSLDRHLQAWWKGETDEDHLAAVAWNAFAAMWTEANKPELDDKEEFPK